MKQAKIIIIKQTIRSTYKGGSSYYEVDEEMRKLGFELLDIITTYRKAGMILNEFDSIYINNKLSNNLI